MTAHDEWLRQADPRYSTNTMLSDEVLRDKALRAKYKQESDAWISTRVKKVFEYRARTDIPSGCVKTVLRSPEDLREYLSKL